MTLNVKKFNQDDRNQWVNNQPIETLKYKYSRTIINENDCSREIKMGIIQATATSMKMKQVFSNDYSLELCHVSGVLWCEGVNIEAIGYPRE